MASDVLTISCYEFMDGQSRELKLKSHFGLQHFVISLPSLGLFIFASVTFIARTVSSTYGQSRCVGFEG